MFDMKAISMEEIEGKIREFSDKPPREIAMLYLAIVTTLFMESQKNQDGFAVIDEAHAIVRKSLKRVMDILDKAGLSSSTPKTSKPPQTN